MNRWNQIQERLRSLAENDEEALQRLFQTRADKLSQIQAAPQRHLEFLVFSLESANYAIPLPAVAAVSPSNSWAPVPGAHPLIVGITSRRGRLYPVVDFAQQKPRPRLVWISHDGFELALAADTVEGIESYPEDEVLRLHQTQGLLSGMVQGVNLLDLGALLRLISPQGGKAGA